MKIVRNAHDAPVRPVKPPKDAVGVVYAETAVAPGLKMFGCTPLRATMSQRGCGARWRDAQDATGYDAERLNVCRGCSIGAAHAGEQHVHHSNLYGASICPACRKGAMRIIHNRTCVNCYNRRREMRAGKNGRGNAPIELLRRPLHTVEFAVAIDGDVRRVRMSECIDRLDAVIQTMRTTKGYLEFGRARPDIDRRGSLAA
jgi:hypothetical protein